MSKTEFFEMLERVATEQVAALKVEACMDGPSGYRRPAVHLRHVRVGYFDHLCLWKGNNLVGEKSDKITKRQNKIAGRFATWLNEWRAARAPKV